MCLHQHHFPMLLAIPRGVPLLGTSIHIWLGSWHVMQKGMSGQASVNEVEKGFSRAWELFGFGSFYDLLLCSRLNRACCFKICLFCVYGWCSYMCISVLCVCLVPNKARSGHHIPGNYRSLWAVESNPFPRQEQLLLLSANLNCISSPLSKVLKLKFTN